MKILLKFAEHLCANQILNSELPAGLLLTFHAKGCAVDV